MIMMRSIVLLALTLLFSQTVTVAAAPTGKYFDKYIIVLLENQDLDSILADPNFKAIATKGLLQTNYHGVAHPSQPNCKSQQELLTFDEYS
jgi:acid phosphatase